MLLGNDNTSAFAEFLHHFVKGEYNQLMINISLGIVVLALAGSIVLSLIFPKVEEATAE
jgi:hypothetical protein